MNHYVKSNQKISDILKIVSEGDVIFLEEGQFHEKITFFQNNITLIGKGQDKSLISFNDHYHKIMNMDSECNTFRTFTIQVLGNNITFKNLSIENTSVPSSKYGQAVALNVLGDNFRAYDVTLRGAQDTLFTGPLPNDLKKRYQGFLNDNVINKNLSRQAYTNCKIIGDVDFIFGCGTALFEGCVIHSINSGYVSAPAHDLTNNFGFLFLDCIFSCDNPDTKVYLARPWRDYGMTTFINCSYGKHILKAGFVNWSGTKRDETCRFSESSENASDIQSRVSFAKILPKNKAIEFVDAFRRELNR